MNFIAKSVAALVAMCLTLLMGGAATAAPNPRVDSLLSESGVERPHGPALRVAGATVDVNGVDVRIHGVKRAKVSGSRHRWQAEGVKHYAQRTGDGAQLLSVLESQSSPTDISYEFPGHELQLQPDGSVAVVDPAGDGKLVAYIEKPWAKDASGRSVPTRYEVAGSTLTQHVTATEETQFPVVADPSIVNKWYGQQIRFSSSETRKIGYGAGSCAIVAAWIPEPLISKIVSSACGALALAAGAARAEGNCLAVNVFRTGQYVPWYWNC